MAACSRSYAGAASRFMIHLLVPFVLGVLPLGGCDQIQEDTAEEGGVEDLTIVVEADKSRILQEEQNLRQKRETVEQERERLAEERRRIQEQLSSLSKKDRSQRAKLEAEEARIRQEEKRMRDRVREFESERAKLESEKTRLLQRISQLSQKGGSSIAQREQALSRRERELAQREEKLAARQKEVARIEAEAVEVLKQAKELLANGQSSAPARTVVVTQPASSGPTASRGQVQRTNRQVRSRMETKGILLADLPPATLERYNSAMRALGNKDYNVAMEGLQEVERIVNGIKIDRGFVEGKFRRINQSSQGKLDKLDEKRRKRVLALLDDVSDSFSDGRYDRANRKINQIHALLAGS